MNMMVRSQILNRIVGRRAPDVVPSDLLRGLVGRKAIGHNDELRELAAVAGELGDEIEQLLMEQDDAAIRATLSTSEQGRVLVRSVDQFLERWGFLSANATDFSETPWIDKPVVIWQGIARAMAAPQQPDRNTAAIREQARARARARLNPVETMIFDRLLASTAAYADCRERMALLFAEDSYHTRLIFLVLADRLVEQGKLDRRDDIFYLAYEEVGQIIGDRLRAEQARALVVARRSEMEADAQLELPDTICGERVPSQPALPADETTILVGIRGSSGRAQGYARVIADPARAPRSLGPTDILVVPFTDVSWTPLFSRIGGVVAETGGQLSHTSIVAREYGLPAVVSVRKATRLIRDGQPITVDGTQGRVYLTHLVEL
jgi:pyruvate,water dikinase